MCLGQLIKLCPWIPVRIIRHSSASQNPPVVANNTSAEPELEQQTQGPIKEPLKPSEIAKSSTQPKIFAETTSTVNNPDSGIRTPSSGGLTPTSCSRLDSDACSRLSKDGSTDQLSTRSASTMGSEKGLKSRLYNARCECVTGSGKYIVPHNEIEALITMPVLKDIIRGHTLEDKVLEYVCQLCSSSKRLVCCLVAVKRSADIIAFLKAGVTDEDLPFHRNVEKEKTLNIPCFLEGKDGKRIELLDKWEKKDREKLFEKQYIYTAPIFELNQHYELDANAILPFVDGNNGAYNKEKTEKRTRGGFGKVYRRTIHPAHHNLFDKQDRNIECQVAVKELISNDEKEFEKEKQMHLKLESHPHLTPLYATFRQDGKWHLIFPWADSNLQEYWEEQPTPKMNPQYVTWSLTEMRGLAEGLERVHNCRVTWNIPLVPGGAGKVRVQAGDVELKVEKDEQWYGRHGDIKPENVLTFMNVLKLADFGLGRFHGRDSRSNVDPKTITCSPTYEPPEVKLGIPVNREYDIWSLGCLYLQFATWLLRGIQGINRFAYHRLEALQGLNGFKDDNFYTIFDNDGEKDAKVREGVESWVGELRQEEQCSQFIHDLLDLVMKHMLLVNSKERIKAKALPEMFTELEKRAESDEEYLYTPRPLPKPPSPPTTPEKLPRSSSNRKNAHVYWPSNAGHSPPEHDLPGHGPSRSDTIASYP